MKKLKEKNVCYDFNEYLYNENSKLIKKMI